MPLIPALGRQRQANLCEFEAGLVYRVIQSEIHRETLYQKKKEGRKEERKRKQKKLRLSSLK